MEERRADATASYVVSINSSIKIHWHEPERPTRHHRLLSIAAPRCQHFAKPIPLLNKLRCTPVSKRPSKTYHGIIVKKGRPHVHPFIANVWRF
jgi:hypothetical protein